MKTRIDLDLLLPEAPDASDACVARLTERLAWVRGIERVHVAEEEGKARLCLHYDPSVVPLESVELAAQGAGADISPRYGHATLPIRLIGSEDSARQLELSLRSHKGVLVASASLPAQIVRVEWDREQTDEDAIRHALRELGSKPDGLAAPRHGEDGTWISRHKELVPSAVAGALLAIGFLGERAGLDPRIAVDSTRCRMVSGGGTSARIGSGRCSRGRSPSTLTC